MTELFSILTVVMVSRVCTEVKTDWIPHFKYMQLIVCQHTPQLSHLQSEVRTPGFAHGWMEG